MNLNIVIPVHNEEENIGKLIEEIDKIRNQIKDYCEILIVNDHSQDNTVNIVKDKMLKYANIKLIANDGRNGLGYALRRSFKEIRSGAIVIVMADFADRIDDIPIMYERIKQGWDVVCGSRYMQAGQAIHHNKIKGFFSKFLGWILHKTKKLPTRDATNSFKMFTYDTLKQIQPLKSRGFTIGLELIIKAHNKGFRITEIPTVFQDRIFGKSSFNIARTIPEYLKWSTYALIKKG